MSQQDDFDRGLKNRRSVLGDAWVDKSLNGATEFNAEFQNLITRYAWHDIWGRPGLDHTTRRLLVLGMTMALGRWEEFELHLGAAVRGGVPLEKLKETMMQGAIYCGVPAANTAFKIALDYLREEGRVPAPQSLAATKRIATHRTFSEPQLKISVQGSGSPVVMSHALGLDMAMWDGLAASLADNHQVLRYDHRGQGGSAAPPGPYTMDDLVDDAARVIREWGRGPVVWIGLSMGGMVGQGVAVRYPELLRGLVLANTTSRYPPEGKASWAQRIAAVEGGGLGAIADMVMERYFNSAFRAGHPDQVAHFRATVMRGDPKAYVSVCHALAAVDWQDQLSQISCPTLVIAGALDVGTPVAMSQAIAERIPKAQLVVLDEASHLSAVEQPALFKQAVKEFLAKLH